MPRPNPDQLAARMACDDKVRYESQARAKHYANLNARRLKRPFKFYSCEFCYGWHIAPIERE